jgi:sporulation protein YlmC with PRC-barrel domain
MSHAYSFGGIFEVIAVAVVCATAASRAQAPAEPEPDAAAGAPGLLASELIGRPVRSANGEAVGEITDLVLSPADRVTSAVVSVGGFLGLGDRHVAVPYDKLVVAPNRTTVLITLSKDQVAAEPEFSSEAFEGPARAGAARERKLR